MTKLKTSKKNNIDPALEDDFRSRDVLRDGDLRSRGTVQNHVETEYVSCTSDPHRIAAPPPLHKKAAVSSSEFHRLGIGIDVVEQGTNVERDDRLRFDFCDDLGNF